jgi:hypothetical protein
VDDPLNEETVENPGHARRLLKRRRLGYNQVRPHSAHGGLTPAQAGLVAAAPPGLVDGPATRPPTPSPCRPARCPIQGQDEIEKASTREVMRKADDASLLIQRSATFPSTSASLSPFGGRPFRIASRRIRHARF